MLTTSTAASMTTTRDVPRITNELLRRWLERSEHCERRERWGTGYNVTDVDTNRNSYIVSYLTNGAQPTRTRGDGAIPW